MTVTIYHNPRCSKSRNTLALLRENGTEPEIVEYLKGALTKQRLTDLIDKIGVPVRDLLRTGEAAYKENKLSDEKWSQDDLIDFVVANPILLNRPIVETPAGATLCRPEELALDLLETRTAGPDTQS